MASTNIKLATWALAAMQVAVLSQTQQDANARGWSEPVLHSMHLWVDVLNQIYNPTIPTMPTMQTNPTKTMKRKMTYLVSYGRRYTLYGSFNHWFDWV